MSLISQSTTTNSSTATFNNTAPFDFSDPEYIEGRARSAVFAGARHVQLDCYNLRFARHFPDMLQEALLALHENAREPAPVAWTRAKFAVTTYVALHIYRWNRTGWTIEDSKRHAPYQNLEDFDDGDRFDGNCVWD